MQIADIFEKYPFQNLVIASQDASKFELRGHEDQFEGCIEEIKEITRGHDYDPEKAQHTVVFGEWGHGKTHLLRSLENNINSTLSNSAKAIYYEPTTTSPKDFLTELADKLQLSFQSTQEFISALKNSSFPPHLFLLIDESQSLVGEDIEIDYETDVHSYYQFLNDLLSEAESQHYNLHLFHGFSANSARAIEKMADIPMINKLRKRIFTLNSLTEDDQWHMITDHIKGTLKQSVEIDPQDIVDRSINVCINKLTGGNPRWVLMLMNEIFNYALNLERIGPNVCFEALKETHRIDRPSQKYFDQIIIGDILDQLNKGQIHEQRIAGLFEARQPQVLGGWSCIPQEDLDAYDLRAGTARRPCPALQNIQIFEQNQEGDFQITDDFRLLIGVDGPDTIKLPAERELLLRLSLDPESLLNDMAEGLESILNSANYPVINKDMRVGHHRVHVVYIDTIPDPVSGLKVRIGIVIFKGHEMPRDVYSEVAFRISEGKCAVAIFIEDTRQQHDNPQSSYKDFLDSYSGPLDISKRFLFICGSDASGLRFDENFFVSLINAANLGREGAAELFKRLRVERRIFEIIQESIYCPTEQERQLLGHIFLIEGPRNLKEIRALDESLDWVKKAKLARLYDFLEKNGSKYHTKQIDQIRPFRYLLKTMRGNESGLSEAELQELIRQHWILTGTGNSILQFLPWSLDVLKSRGFVELRDGKWHYKDIDEEIRGIEEACKRLLSEIQKKIEEFYDAGFVRSRSHAIEQRVTEISQKVGNERSYKKVTRKNIIEGCLQDLEELLKELEALPAEVKEVLLNEMDVTANELNEFKVSAFWPYPDIEDPYNSYVQDAEVELSVIMDLIELPVPKEKDARQKIKHLRERIEILLDELQKEVPVEFDSNTEGIEIGEVKFQIYSAIRLGLKGKVVVSYFVKF